MHLTMKIPESSSLKTQQDLEASEDGASTRPSTEDTQRKASLLFPPLKPETLGRRASSFTLGFRNLQKSESAQSLNLSPVEVLGFAPQSKARKRSQADNSLSIEREHSSGAWKGSTKYIRAAAKMSSYLFGSSKTGSSKSSGETGSRLDPSSVSVRTTSTGLKTSASAMTPLSSGFTHSLRILDWAPVTYPHDRATANVSERVVGFCVYRTFSLCRRSKRPAPDPSSRLDGGPVLLHPQNAICLFRIPERLSPEETSIGDIDPEFFDDLMSSMTPISSDGRELRQPGTLGRSSQGDSMVSAASHDSTPQRGPSLGNILGLGSDYSVVRYVKAKGVVVAKPTAVERYGLDGRLQKRVNMVAEGDGQVWLIDALETSILGVGSVVICTTSSFKVLVYRCADLRLVRDINLSIWENSYRRYIREHAVRPVEDDRGVPTALLCPSGFARRNGQLFVGTSSGLVHIWRLPDGFCECLLPPPLPLGHTVGVVDIVYHTFLAAVRDGLEDIGSPAWDVLQSERPEPHARMHRFCSLWVLYEDGRAALWEVDELRSSENVEDAAYGDPSDTLAVGDVSGPFSDQYASIESPLEVNSSYTLKQIFDWSKAPLLRPEFANERTQTFLESVTLVRAIASEKSPVVCLLLRSESPRAMGEHALMMLSPLADKPAVAFISLRTLGVPNCPHTTFASTLTRLHLTSLQHAGHLAPRTCLVMAFSGVIRVIQIDIREDCSSAMPELKISLFPLATQLVRRRTAFTSVKYDEDFDELLLGLESGELVTITEFAKELQRQGTPQGNLFL